MPNAHGGGHRVQMAWVGVRPPRPHPISAAAQISRPLLDSNGIISLGYSVQSLL